MQDILFYLIITTAQGEIGLLWSFLQSALTSFLLDANTFLRLLHSHVLNLMFFPQYERHLFKI